jgi:hypothetical protein
MHEYVSLQNLKTATAQSLRIVRNTREEMPLPGTKSIARSSSMKILSPCSQSGDTSSFFGEPLLTEYLM